ncbi:MAG: HEAT repeat domain-containing protein [Chitinophagaceae bacterium]|nr:HEAT repeat domain-containing protein [Chitinophagaceae bacterium]
MRQLTFLTLCLIGSFLVFTPACKNSTKEKNENEAAGESGDKFADNIRKTDFQSPEDERKGFKLPPGFEITLFASEPDINKPINMEFDEKGRLWVTNTVEYPKPAAPGKGRDRITILEDTDGDGKADKFTHFVDSLNIPIGITPVKQGAIAYSIPNVYKFIDKDGDGKSDETTKLLGPFEFMDTHGMVNNLIRSYDGWVHACHGYANHSIVAGKDGDSIDMNSGNTFRFREDGSRAEITTHGRINPFGYAFDEWGYLYSLDCHTKPIYQLIHGAQYPAQGGQEPTIGWAPIMMSYEFGSTANSGLVYYTGTQFPDEYKNNFYSGNVVTSRINRNTMRLDGSSPISKREEDFLISDDPWFRPVDLKTGPDGSIYVADFYNRIIGHYEVPKDHPGRDRTSGRIWKITYTGNKNSNKYVPKDWSKATLDELVKALNYPQLNIRMILANYIVDNYPDKAVAPVRQLLESGSADSKSFIQALWILYRLNALPDNLIEKALTHSDPMVQVHGLRVLGELKTITPKHRELAVNALNSKNPQVQRMAVEVLGHFPQFNFVQPLIALYNNTGEGDTHLKYTTLLSIRDHLKNAAIMKQVADQKWDDKQVAVIVKVLPEVPSKEAAYYALNYMQTHALKGKQLEDNLKFISRYATPADLDKLIAVTRKNVTANSDEDYKLYASVREGVLQKGIPVSASLKKWGTDIAGGILQNPQDSSYRLVQASKIAADLKLTELEPSLAKILTNKSLDSKSRITAAETLFSLSPQKNEGVITTVFNDASDSEDLRAMLSMTLGQLNSSRIFSMFESTLKNAPRKVKVNIATVLANTPEGIDYLLRALKEGNLPTDVLEELPVKDRLTSNMKSTQRQELNKLTAGKLGTENRKEIIAARLGSFDPSSVTVEQGQEVFTKNCNMCHTIGNNPGGQIGPKLSGIGTWGPNALAEKILDPNSNISDAFRTYNITLNNGKTLSGLFRRNEGAVEVFADFSGQEFSVPKADIKEKVASKYTLMPDNFRNTIAKKDFDALLKFLLSQKEK